MKKIFAGLSKHRMVILIIAFFFVAIIASGSLYYLKTHQPKADTLVRNTSCVIKVVDGTSKLPLKGVSVSFNVFPKNPVSLSKVNGCVGLPAELANAPVGDYYQVDLYRPGYGKVVVHLPITQDTITGKNIETSKLYLTGQPVASADSSKVKVTNTSQPQGSDTNSHLISSAKAADSRVLNVQLAAYDNLSKETISGAVMTLEYRDWQAGKWNKITCTTNLDIFHHCNLMVKEEIIKDRNTRVYAEHADYETYRDFLEGSELKGFVVGEVDVFIPMKPILVENVIGTFAGKSLAAKCQGTTNIQASWYGSKDSFVQKPWDAPTIQKIANNLATVICALKQSDPAIKYLPVPKIQILQNMDLKGAAGYVYEGSAIINIDNKQFCGGLDETARTTCRKDIDWLFVLPVHEYGHILDLGGPTSGIFSKDNNLKNLFVLVNADDVKDGHTENMFTNCPKTATIENPYYDGAKCYYTMNEKEFWSESFALWMGQSLSSDLGLNDFVLTLKTIPMIVASFTGQDLNVFKFWKKFVVTALGSFCHPTIYDDNLKKTGLTYAGPPWDLIKMVIGGRILGEYSPDAILAGTATNVGIGNYSGFINVTYKQLPADFPSSGLIVGVAPNCEVAKGTANYRSCAYGPYSVLASDIDPGLKKSDQTFHIPLDGFNTYNITARYYCPNQTRDQATAVPLATGVVLNTQKNSYDITVNFGDKTKFPPCKTIMPNQPPGMQQPL